MPSITIHEDGDVTFLLDGRTVFVGRGVMRDLCGSDHPTIEKISQAFERHRQQFVLIGTATNGIDVIVARRYGLT